MEELYKSKDPTTTTTIPSGQVQKSANKKKSKNKKTHIVNTMDEELIKTTTTTTREKIDQCTNNDNDDKNTRTDSVLTNGIVEQVENLHIKDNGYCLSNGSKLNGHQYDGAQHVSETTTTTTIAPAKQLVNEKSKKNKSKSKNKENCQLKNVEENCVENGDSLSPINTTGKPTVLSTAKETIVTEQKQQQSHKVRDIIATAVAAADIEEVKPTEEETLVTNPALEQPKIHIDYTEYQSELQMHDIMRLIQAELSEPYSIYTYRYFIYNWPKLCFLAAHGSEYVGAIVCKLDMHVGVKRGYIAMLAVRKEYRNLRIGTTLVQKAIEAMVADNADEVVLETEMRNFPALHLYENLGFVRDKRLFRYYLNGVDALRLKLWFR